MEQALGQADDDVVGVVAFVLGLLGVVLAFVFGLNAAAGGSPMAPPALPAIDVPPGARFDENGDKLL